jgi:integrase/recombinase XerC
MTPLERFARALQGEGGKSAATRAAYLADAALLVELLGDIPIERATQAHLRACVRRLHAQGMDPRSIARRLSAWRAWFRVLVREMGLPANPAEGIRAPRAARTLPRPPGLDATQAFLAAMPDDEGLAARDRALIELAYSSGLRLAELVSLDLDDFEDGGRFVRVLGKGGKTRVVPVGQAARQAIAHWQTFRATLARPGETALFVSRLGTRIGPRAVQQRLAHWGRQLGLPERLHPHKLRHACATHFLQSSQDLRAAQELLGHAQLTSTQVYTQLDFQHLAKVYDAAHPRARRMPPAEERD